MYTTVIDCNSLKQHLADDDWVVVDCRYDLFDKDAGRNAYLESHIPGAVFADLHDDLCGPPLTDHGRHPLPSPQQMNSLFVHLGINNNAQVVIYDDVYGSFAGRLWWMLRYMGHDKCAVLDGGWQTWQQSGFPVVWGREDNPAGNFQGQPNRDWLVTVDQIQAIPILIDSRDPARYRGESEPIDRVAGHIPGAVNRFWKENLDSKGFFKSPHQLREEFLARLDGTAASETAVYCGSGVTACHNLLAAAHAGLPVPRLYAGSWSEWCSDPNRPVATGEN